MRTEMLVTNRRCNQACTFCDRRSSTDDLARIAYDAVVTEARRLLESGAEEIVITGGEPTLRRDLERIVAAVRETGTARIVLETNATLLDAQRAMALNVAGVDVVRVHLPGWGASYERTTRDPGSFAACLAGLDALRSAGACIELSIPIVHGCQDGIADVPSRIADRLGRGAVHTIVVDVPTDAPDASELLPPSEAAQIIERLVEAADAHDIEVRVRPGAPLAPCLFRRPRRFSGAFALSRGEHAARSGWRHLAACEACLMADSCPGLPVALIERHGEPPMAPIRDELARRRLTLFEPPDDVAKRLLRGAQVHRTPEGRAGTQHVIRVLYRCNQTCRFCFVPTHLNARPLHEVRAAIAEAAAEGGQIALSGGEPTLHPDLVELVRFAADRSDEPVWIQTNAVLLDDPARVAALKQAGLRNAFVSLHGSCTEVGDRVTGAPGTWARTVVGIDHLVAAGVTVVLNFVICGANHHDLPATIRLIAKRWPSAVVALSFVATSTDLVPRDADTIPRYSDVAPHLAEAARLASALGVKIDGLDSMCALPFCTLPEGLVDWRSLASADAPDGDELFVRGPACAVCAARTKRWGVRPAYAKLHGLSELVALE